MTMPAQTLHARTKPYARDFYWKSWWCVLSTAFLLGVAVAGTLPWLPLIWRMASSILAGLLLVRLFVIYHDQQHRAILPRSHDYHHSHNCKLRSANIGSFPIMTLEQYRQTSAGGRVLYLFMRHP